MKPGVNIQDRCVVCRIPVIDARKQF